jgi:D-alanine-D-alanine ligase-like ATP-grasp enzyme
MRRKTSATLFSEGLKRAAPLIGARVYLEPRWGVVGQITFKNGKKRYFRHSNLDLNTLGASELSKDKDYANLFMKKMGYPTPVGEAFCSTPWARTIGSNKTPKAARAYAKKLGFPVIVKPNSRSQGLGVSLARNEKEFTRALSSAFTLDRVILVQQPVWGIEYRIVVLDTAVISAYERTPLCVVGNGILTIAALLKEKQREFIAAGRDTKLQYTDPRMKEKLASQKLTWKSIPKSGERIFLLDNANLSCGGDATDVTDAIHPGFKRIAVQLTKDMGLRLCGVDLMLEGSIKKAPGVYSILETNAAPGFDHYARGGAKQKKVMQRIFIKVLRALAK